MEDIGYAGILHPKYWMPIHYDTIKDGQNKKSVFFYSLTIQHSISIYPISQYACFIFLYLTGITSGVNDGEDLWIGLNDITSEGTYVWTDGTTVS